MSMPAPAKPSPLGVRPQGRVADAVPALFDTTMLKDEMDIQAAIGAISRHLVDPTTRLEDAVVELHSNAPAHVLELVLCSASDAYRVLVAAILEGYQRELDGVLSSPAPELLSRFALCHWFLPDVCPATANALDAAPILRWKDAEAGTAVLKEISKLSFGSKAHVHCEPSDDRHLPLGMKFARSQGERKRARRGKDAPSIDQEVFTRYGARVPETPAGMRSLTKTICDAQRCALSYYLGVFRRPEVVAAMKSIFLAPPSDNLDELSEDASTCPFEDSEDASACSYESSEEDAAEPAVFQNVRANKVVRLFDSLDGFGEWPLKFTPRAARDLRQARDRKMFGIFVKKLQELSRGHFSEDNQKRLTGVHVYIPVYEAKMTGDTRLIYQVDCDEDTRNGVERQILTIRGIYTHAQIDRRWKDSMRHERQLANGQPKDAEYKKRCMYRNPPAHPGDNVYTPATWRLRRATV